MKKQYKWEIVWAMIAVTAIIICVSWGIGWVINRIDLVPHQIYTFEGVQYKCEFPAPDVMNCEKVGDPDVGFGRQE